MTADRRVFLVTVVLWTMVTAGPVLATVALLRPLPAAVAQGAPVPVPGTLGLAEVAVVAHLTAVPGQLPAALVPAHPALRPPTDVLDGLPTSARSAAVAAVRPVSFAATVSAVPAGPGRWGVTVAVLRDGRLEGWQVSVAETPTGPHVETVPAAVGLPHAGAPATPALTVLRGPRDDDALAATVGAFLTAFLTGEGDLARYLAPNTTIARPELPVDRVELWRIGGGPVDATRMAVLAEARVHRDDGAVHVLQYPLLLGYAGDRWEVHRLLPAVPVQPRPTSATTQPAVPDDEGNTP